MSSNLLRLNPSKTEFIIIGLPAQIKEIPDPSIHLSDNSSSTSFTSAAPVRNLGVTFDPHLSFSNHISNRSCFMHIRDLRRIRPMLEFKTASTIATSIVHSKLDYCNSLFLSLDSTQIHRLQLIQNSLARAVNRTPRHHHITPVLKSLHSLKIPERIHFKVLSLTYNSLQSSQPTYAFANSSPSSQHALFDHHPVSPFLDPRSLLISCFPTEPYKSLHHVFGMTYHLNSASFLRLPSVIANHKTSSSSASSIRHPQGLPLKIKMSSLQTLLPRPFLSFPPPVSTTPTLITATLSPSSWYSGNRT